MFSTRQHLDDPTLVSRLDRELSTKQADAVDAHLATCERCRARINALLAAEMSVRIALRAESDAHHHARTRASLARALGQEARRSRSWGWRGRPVLAPVAAAALVVGIALAYVSRDSGTQREDASALPIPRFTPGATTSLTAAQLCSGVQPPRMVPAGVAERVLNAYAMENLSPDEYELDALITPELGGTAAAENLWPQRYTGGVWTAHVKDEIEDQLRELVCDGQLDLATAQRDMATNWIAAYKKYLHRDMPVPDHRSFDAGAALTIASTRRDLAVAPRRVALVDDRVAIE